MPGLRKARFLLNKSLSTVERTILAATKSLVGLPLGATSLAADIRAFQFGQIRSRGRAWVGQYAIHVQCPWRITFRNRLVVGSDDDYLVDDMNDSREQSPMEGVLQSTLFVERLGLGLKGLAVGSDVLGGGVANRIVKAISTDKTAGLTVRFTNGFLLEILPTSSSRENWRLFRPGSDDPHCVIVGVGVVWE